MLISGDDERGVDAGFYLPVLIGDRVWEDRNYNGIQDAGENNVSGVHVCLIMDGTVTATCTDTNVTGEYRFEGLAPGHTYGAEFNLTVVNSTGKGYRFTAKDAGDDAADSDADRSTGQTAETPLARSGDVNLTLDAGVYAPVSIGSFVWRDTNGNGVQEAGEPGIAGAVLHLLVKQGTAFVDAVDAQGNPVDDNTTGAGGKYLFENLPDGMYKIRVTAPAGYTASPHQTATNDNDATDDSNLASGSGTTFESGEFNLTAGTEPTEAGGMIGDDQDNTADTNGNMTVDFGFIPDGKVSIGSTVFYDIDITAPTKHLNHRCSDFVHNQGRFLQDSP